MTQTTLELRDYYRNLLILQYLGKPKARATVEAQATAVLMAQTTVQQITFSAAADAGSLTISWDDVAAAPIAWDDTAATIQAILRAIPGLEAVTVTGAIADLALTVTFEGVQPIAASLVVDATTLEAAGDAVDVSVVETDVTIPLAIQSAFNLVGDSPAVGVQLDVLGKYAGVIRTAQGFTTQITLDDADFLSLIKMAIITNNSGSSLATIQELILQFFEGQVTVADDKLMHLTYLVSSLVGSQELMQVYLTEGLLPKPMGVGVNLIYLPVVTMLFGFRTYEAEGVNVSPFNTYEDYQTDWPWLAYEDVIVF